MSSLPDICRGNHQGEEWKTIPSFPNYEASSFGRVRRAVTNKYHPKPRMLRCSPEKRTGYPKATMFRDSKRYSMHVHRLVTEAFIGPCPFGWVVNHLDANRSNNHIDNLEYTTPLGNVRHAKALGRMPTGDDHPARKRPETRPRGDSHYSRARPECLARGDRNGSRVHRERMPRGESHKRSKLNNNAVRAIRDCYATGKFRLVDLAVVWGVHVTQISRIVRRSTWAHVD